MNSRNRVCRAGMLIAVSLISLSGCGGSGTSGGAATTTAITGSSTPSPDSTPQATNLIPNSPTGVSALGGTNKVTLSWNAVAGATLYNVYWSTAAGGAEVSGNAISAFGSSYIHRGLPPSTTYYYVVTAKNGSGESEASGEISSTTALLDGATPYTTNCAFCHGSLATSSATNRSVSEIEAALQNNSNMSGLIVSDAQIEAISAALMYND